MYAVRSTYLTYMYVLISVKYGNIVLILILILILPQPNAGSLPLSHSVCFLLRCLPPAHELSISFPLPSYLERHGTHVDQGVLTNLIRKYDRWQG
jgi:hypothetical protein